MASSFHGDFLGRFPAEIVDFTEQRCPVLDRPRGNPSGQAPLGRAQDSPGLAAIMEKHCREDPGNEIVTRECWVLLNSGIAVTIETP